MLHTNVIMNIFFLQENVTMNVIGEIQLSNKWIFEPFFGDW